MVSKSTHQGDRDDKFGRFCRLLIPTMVEKLPLAPLRVLHTDKGEENKINKVNDTTYSTNNALHSSSDRVNACSARHVPPNRSRSAAFRYSRNWANSSSGSRVKKPHAVFRFSLAVKAFPEGRTPRGWRRTAFTCRDSPSSAAVESSNEGSTCSTFCFFDGRMDKSASVYSLRIAAGGVIVFLLAAVGGVTQLQWYVGFGCWVANRNQSQ